MPISANGASIQDGNNNEISDEFSNTCALNPNILTPPAIRVEEFNFSNNNINENEMNDLSINSSGCAFTPGKNILHSISWLFMELFYCLMIPKEQGFLTHNHALGHESVLDPCL